MDCAVEGSLGSDLTLPTACWLCLRLGSRHLPPRLWGQSLAGPRSVSLSIERALEVSLPWKCHMLLLHPKNLAGAKHHINTPTSLEFSLSSSLWLCFKFGS